KEKTDKVAEVTSKRRFVKVTPDKVRTAAALVKGKNAVVALGILDFSSLAAAKPLILTLKNAISIAKDRDLKEDDLQVSIIRVDEGPKLKRRRIVHQGRATAILKRMSHITVVLTDKPNIKSKVKKIK
ncbi:MAG: 50S ribosomal protein L22, partial [Patescibacteria group bacterium]